MDEKKQPLKDIFGFDWLGTEPKETEYLQRKNTGITRKLNKNETIKLVKLGFLCDNMVSIAHELQLSVFSIENRLGAIAIELLKQVNED